MIQELYNSLTVNKITFMKDLNDFFEISPKSKYKYFNLFRFEIKEISDFLYYLEDENIYIVIPMITVSKSLDDPVFILSRQFFVSNNSNSVIIQNYLSKQLEIAREQFNMDLQEHNMFFKYRKVFVSRNSKLH
jgi:hypothetical protein